MRTVDFEGWNEQRLAALKRYRILDTVAEPELDDVVALVSAICEVPIALVSLVDIDRQWFKAKIGVEVTETALDTSVCALAIRQDDVFIIEDLAADPRTAQMSLVTGAPRVRFYAGAPLITTEGHALGSLCAIDTESRPEGLTPEQLRVLKVLARHVVTHIELKQAIEARDKALVATETRRVIEELDAAKAREAEALIWKTSPDLMVILNFEGIVQRVNPAWTMILGFEPWELIGRHIFSLVFKDDLPLTERALANAVKGVLQGVMNRYCHKDGSVRWFSWVAAPSENVIYATGRDITLEREAAAQLRKAEDDLRQAQKVDAIGQLTGGVAHDFNNFLTVIQGSVELLGRPSISEERKNRYLNSIKDATERAASLTRQLLAFARRSPLKPEIFDVGKSLAGMSDLVRTLTGSLIETTLDISGSPCFVVADKNQFDTAIVNMVVNARDAMNHAGSLKIAVNLALSIPALREHPIQAGKFVAVSVTDTGPGIAPDKIDLIFQPFYTTKTEGKGTGLGLSQLFGFTKQSGGQVHVESRGGAGATFTVYLPAADAPGLRENQEKPVPCPIADGARVLVVEDNAEVGLFVTEALAVLGYEVVLAVDAEHALVLLAQPKAAFDVVFSDVVMPGKNGVELAKEMQQLYPKIPVLLTSGFSKVIAEQGTHGFELLQKPYSIEDLSRSLARSVSTGPLF